MQKLKMFSIRDGKGEIFHAPFYAKTHGEAERTFNENASNPESMIHKYPQDYDLYFVGEYDDQTGKLKAEDTPQHMIKAVNLPGLRQSKGPSVQ